MYMYTHDHCRDKTHVIHVHWTKTRDTEHFSRCQELTRNGGYRYLGGGREGQAEFHTRKVGRGGEEGRGEGTREGGG